MIAEATTYVLLDGAQWDARCADVAGQAALAMRRDEKTLPGDRSEALRLDALCERVETVALELADSGAARSVTVADAGPEPPGARLPWLTAADSTRLASVAIDVRRHVKAGGVAVEIRDPFARSGAATARPPAVIVGAHPPATVWRPPPNVGVGTAQRALWEGQLESAVATGSGQIVPSGLGNRALTQGLRRFVAHVEGERRVVARVTYRDGSEGPAFPLRGLRLVDSGASPPSDWPVLRFALLSLRHPEMDPLVDGAWLRNRIISQVRPAGETDQIAYELSLAKLGSVCAGGPVAIELFQTGLEPAILGFYRALTAHLLESPGSVWVTPQHHRRASDTYGAGHPWATR